MAKTVKQNQQLQDKEKEAYAFYVSRGWTPEQAIGIVGNLIRESNLNTTIVGTADDKKSQGVAQWHGDRLKTLKKKYGDKWTDFNNQLDFVDWELKNTEKAAGDKLKASKGAWQAGSIVSDHYERPKVKFVGDKTRQKHVADLTMKFKGVKLTPEDMPYYGATYANSVAPHINQSQKQEIIIPTISNFDVSTNSPTFVPEETKTEVVENKNIQDLQQKANEKSFLEDLYAQEDIQPQYGESQDEVPQQQIPKTNFANVYNQVSQFVEQEIAQQGGSFTENELAFLSEIAIKDNNGYWNPNNQGKVVEIEGNQITMNGVGKDLIGISKETGEQKLMKSGKDYTFGKKTKNVIEIPNKQ